MERIYGMHKLVGLQLFWSRTPTFASGTPTFCQMGVLNSCFQNPSEGSVLQKQSDLDLPYFSMPFWQATSVQNFRTLLSVSITSLPFYCR